MKNKIATRPRAKPATVKKKIKAVNEVNTAGKSPDSFFAMVYEVVKLVPKGRVTSYGAIARYLGTGRSSRMVGWAMNSAHSLSGVPAHRVVNRNGLLTGKHHFGSPTRMQELLEKEGIMVKADQVQDFKRLNWDPAVELAL